VHNEKWKANDKVLLQSFELHKKLEKAIIIIWTWGWEREGGGSAGRRNGPNNVCTYEWINKKIIWTSQTAWKALRNLLGWYGPHFWEKTGIYVQMDLYKNAKSLY
jgi:hypothetical protein